MINIHYSEFYCMLDNMWLQPNDDDLASWPEQLALVLIRIFLTRLWQWLCLNTVSACSVMLGAIAFFCKWINHRVAFFENATVNPPVCETKRVIQTKSVPLIHLWPVPKCSYCLDSDTHPCETVSRLFSSPLGGLVRAPEHSKCAGWVSVIWLGMSNSLCLLNLSWSWHLFCPARGIITHSNCTVSNLKGTRAVTCMAPIRFDVRWGELLVLPTGRHCVHTELWMNSMLFVCFT